jgi:hypothetical protein
MYNVQILATMFENLIDEVKELGAASKNSRARHFGGPTNQTSFVECSFTRSDAL